MMASNELRSLEITKALNFLIYIYYNIIRNGSILNNMNGNKGYVDVC